MKTRRQTVVVFKDTANRPEWRWHIISGGNVIAESGEGYTRRPKLFRALRSLISAMASRNYRLVDEGDPKDETEL